MNTIGSLLASVLFFVAYLVPPVHPMSKWWIPIDAAMITGGIYFAVLAAVPELSNAPKSDVKTQSD
jgi:hypothetical protein